MTALMTIENLKKYYPIKTRSIWPSKPSFLHAVDDLSFEVRSGETIGLVGESGSGKSTLAEALAKLTVPTGGRITLQGRDLSRYSSREFSRSPLRSQVQMVFQDAGESWNPRFTAFDAVAHPLKRLRGLQGRALDEKVRHAADMVAFPHNLLLRYPHQLSGGQRARIGIARAVAVEPALLILDEPTSALDISIQAVILQLLDRIRRELGIAFIFVSHDLNVVRLLCDRIMIMYLGRIVEDGPTEQIFTAPRHPYTASLIDAIPGATRRSSRRIRLDGDPRSPVDPDANVCRFFGRCPKGQVEPCTVTDPELRPLVGGRLVACHLPMATEEEIKV